MVKIDSNRIASPTHTHKHERTFSTLSHAIKRKYVFCMQHYGIDTWIQHFEVLHAHCSHLYSGKVTAVQLLWKFVSVLVYACVLTWYDIWRICVALSTVACMCICTMCTCDYHFNCNYCSQYSMRATEIEIAWLFSCSWFRVELRRK